jgi:hypothetical protein
MGIGFTEACTRLAAADPEAFRVLVEEWERGKAIVLRDSPNTADVFQYAGRLTAHADIMRAALNGAAR